MTDPLTVVGGIASFAQVLGCVVKTAQVTYNIYHAVQDAPDELRRINETLLALKVALESTRIQVGDLDDDELLPPDLRCIMQNTITSIYKDVVALKQKCHGCANSDSAAIRERLKWALIERRIVGNLLERLKGSESSLTCVLQLINIRMSLLVYSSQKRLAQTKPRVLPLHKASSNHCTVTKVQLRTAVVNADSWLCKFGLYGFLSVVSGIDNDEWRSRICVGFKPPTWIWSNSITLDLQFMNAACPGGGFRILPGTIQFQNQVPLNSPFMVACAKGDVRLISQHLVDRTGYVGDRASCCGKTPLLLAIEGQHLDAIRYLLESGADPNVGDDQQILPVFAVSGMISEPAKVFPQLPPKWDSWIEALKLLLYHGASVHEAVGERTLSMLNINHRFGEEKTMEFFNVLVAEGYTYWETTHKAGWSAVLTAIRTRQDSLRALWLLKRTGTDIARILSDGRSPLHLAAELADDASILEYLYDAGCSKDLNRQDMWGWTPLHYGIAAAAINPSCPKSLEKINFFLDKGAYLDIKGRKRPLLTSDTMTTDEFTPGQLCKALKPSLHSKLVDMARAAGREEAGLE